MGRVWIADHLGLNTQVVVKVMAEEMAARSDGAERFAREAAACAAIKSPHVVQIFDHGRTPEGVPYIVMELLEGKDLGAYIEQHGRMDPTQVMNVVVQIGKALSKAHRAGIIHRDIKPDNIFICDTDDGQLFVKLLDFGTAKRHDASSRATIPGQIMGTPYYMSPEQSVGAETDERSDLWSLGVVVFEAVTGVRPFDGVSIGAITMAIHGPTPMMASYVEDVPPALDDWFARACAQQPNDRFPTVREATHALAFAVTGIAPVDQPTESLMMPPTFPGPMARETRTRSNSNSNSSSTPIRPVTRPSNPLIDTLPKRSERTTTIAAGMVMAVAGLAMAAIILGRSPAPPPAAETATTNAATAQAEAPPTPPAVPTPAPSAAPSVEQAKAEPAPSAAAVAKAQITSPSVVKAMKHAPIARPDAKPALSVPSSVRPAAMGRPREDEDLVKLEKASAKHADPPVESPPASAAVAPTAPTPTPSAPAPLPAPTPAPAPADSPTP
jgi:eukaryotic-like serine/threonine-protein kinase